jgi:predicted small secreted protein
MVRKVTSLLLIAGALAIAACNTVRGAGEDLGSAANCTENAINGGNC